MKNLIIILSIIALSQCGLNTVSSQNTYTINGTTYISGESYETGHPKVKRSQSNVDKFLKGHGYSKVPYGYQVDHIIPLSQGGKDTPDNMQLITIGQHKQKTAMEKKSSSTYNTYSNSIYKTNNPLKSYSKPGNSYTIPKNTFNYNSSSSKTIYTGSRGGKYYINSKGNKTYIKK